MNKCCKCFSVFDGSVGKGYYDNYSCSRRVAYYMMRLDDDTSGKYGNGKCRKSIDYESGCRISCFGNVSNYFESYKSQFLWNGVIESECTYLLFREVNMIEVKQHDG